MEAPFSITVNVVEYDRYNPSLPHESKTNRFMCINSAISDRSVLFSKSETITHIVDVIFRNDLTENGVIGFNFFISKKVFIVQRETKEGVDEIWYEDNHSIGSNFLAEAKAGKSTKEFFDGFREKSLPRLQVAVIGFIPKIPILP